MIKKILKLIADKDIRYFCDLADTCDEETLEWLNDEGNCNLVVKYIESRRAKANRPIAERYGAWA